MKNFIFVTDFLPTEIVGGAELTFDAIFQAAPKEVKIQYIKSEFVNPSHWLMPNTHWVLGNYTRLPKETIEALCELAQRRQISYSVVEFDYKYCVVRNEKVHNYHVYKSGNFGFCNCPNQPIGTYTKVIFGFAEKVHFMSQGQMDLVLRRLPELNANKQNFRVQWSTWSKKDIEFIESLYESKKSKESNNKWAIQESGNWLKGSAEGKEIAEQKGYEVDVVPSMEYRKFLETLSGYKGLVFLPNAWDTCPRIVVEAKLLGLELELNDNVQIKEEILKSSREEILEFINGNATKFWESYQL